MKGNILFLFFNDPRNNNILLDEIDKIEGVSSACVLRPVGLFLRLLRRIHIASGLPGISIWFLDWKKNIENYNIVVCIASRYSPGILRWVKRKNPRARCINYFWDSVAISRYPIKSSDDFENWSFNSEDCKKYNMHYNPQFFISNIKLRGKEIYDVTYVGADRNGILQSRSKLVKKYDELFTQYKIKHYFYYVSDSEIVPKQIRHSKPLSEQQFYDVSAQGKAMLDIVEPDVQWLTLRPLLALKNGKKVITNNKNICNEIFYSKDNVFILGVDNMNNLKKFVTSDFKKIDESYLKYYSVEEWIKRFN